MSDVVPMHASALATMRANKDQQLLVAVFFDPSSDDPTSGRITETVIASLEHILAQGRAFRIVPARLNASPDPLSIHAGHRDYDATHEVLKGEVVPRDLRRLAAERAEAAMRLLRIKRNGLLKDVVDHHGLAHIWEDLSEADRAAVRAYRQALRDLPATAADPEQPDWPTLTLSKDQPHG